MFAAVVVVCDAEQSAGSYLAPEWSVDAAVYRVGLCIHYTGQRPNSAGSLLTFDFVWRDSEQLDMII